MTEAEERTRADAQAAGKPHHRGRIALAVVLALLAALVIGMAAYFGDYYHAVDVDGYFDGSVATAATSDDDAAAAGADASASAGAADEDASASAGASSAAVAVGEIDGGWLFDGPGEGTALIFYPGAKVEASAYAPLMYELAQEGVDCFLLRMPLRFAIFDMDAALDVVDAYSADYDSWILSGHSLGGAMAASCAAANPGTFDGLVLLAAYSTESLADDDLWLLSLYGSEDGVLSMDKVAAGRDLAPEDYEEICIEGGNHALFGSYGAQDGDGEASITPEEQRQAVVDAVCARIAEG